jgi:hypothetical protein
MAWIDSTRRLMLRLAPGSRMLPPARRPMEFRVAGEKANRSVVFAGAPIDVRL